MIDQSILTQGKFPFQLLFLIWKDEDRGSEQYHVSITT